MTVEFSEYRDNLILISKLHKLPDKIIVKGVVLTKGFKDTNDISYSHHITSQRCIREVSCGYCGRRSDGSLIITEVSCSHWFGGEYGVYYTKITNKEILDLILENRFET